MLAVQEVLPVPPLVTGIVPYVVVAQPKFVPSQVKKELASEGELIKAVVLEAVWNGIRFAAPPEILVAVAALPVVFWFSVGNVQFAKLPDAGVPKAGVTKVGEFDRTTEPEPVELVTPVPPDATANVADNPAAVPVVFWFNVGMSAATKARNEGVPEEPLGAANT